VRAARPVSLSKAAEIAIEEEGILENSPQNRSSPQHSNNNNRSFPNQKDTFTNTYDKFRAQNVKKEVLFGYNANNRNFNSYPNRNNYSRNNYNNGNNLQNQNRNNYPNNFQNPNRGNYNNYNNNNFNNSYWNNPQPNLNRNVYNQNNANNTNHNNNANRAQPNFIRNKASGGPQNQRDINFVNATVDLTPQGNDGRHYGATETEVSTI
jgi:hypothetical protein